jgi:hypothetical protein
MRKLEATGWLIPRFITVFATALLLPSALLLTISEGAEAKQLFPALKGLNKVKVDVHVSGDVKEQLLHAGAPNFVVGGELGGLAESKLKEAGISTGGLSEALPRLNITADTDMSTDEMVVTLACLEPVTLVRDPSIKFETKVWSKSGHPTADEAKELKVVLADLLDQFIADRLAANETK